MNGENLPEIIQSMPENMVMVDKNQLLSLVEQNTILKQDLGVLIGVFKGFSSLLTGKGGIMSIVPVITKIINNPDEMEKLGRAALIIEKYTENNG